MNPVGPYALVIRVTRTAASVMLPLVVFIAANAMLVTMLLICPSFGMIGLIYNFNTLAMPCLLVIAAALGLRAWWLQKQRFHLVVSLAMTVCAVVLVGLRVWATHVEPHRLMVREVTIRTTKVSRPLKILHISDIQAGSVGSHEERAFAAMRRLKPDMVLFTGDLLQPPGSSHLEAELHKMSALFETLQPPMGLFGVWGDVDGLLRKFPSSRFGGLRILQNSDVTVDRDGVRIRLLGIDRWQSRQGSAGSRSIARAWLDVTDLSDFTIAIGHAPDYVLAVKDLPIDLCLAGHTHGGQIRLPLIGPPVTLSKVPRAWARGFREVGQTRLNVSAGIGCERTDDIPAIRLGCPAEMTLITLMPERRN